MDFPLELSNKWVSSIDELKQNIDILLKDPIGTFIQSHTIGAKFSIHSTIIDELEEGIRMTLIQIPYLTVDSVEASSDTDFSIRIIYNNEVINFVYSINV